MAASIFKTNPVPLRELLGDAQPGKLQLPDFQRSWVWDEERIRSLIASISRSFPVGALMTLETGGVVDFKPRTIEGAPDAAKNARPTALLLDGQQRITSLFQAILRSEVMETRTARGKTVRRWFYVDIARALDESANREDAIVAVPENKRITSDFGRKTELDLSTREQEYAHGMFPLAMLFAWDDWYDDWITWSRATSPDTFDADRATLRRFDNEIIKAFEDYQLPVISLGRDSSKEAVCTVFEKVNTGGKALDAFELITAMYAADGHELRKDWYGSKAGEGRHARLAAKAALPEAKVGILADVSSTDFLHVISLFHTRDLRKAAEDAGNTGRDLPQVIGNRAALLNLPLSAYLTYQQIAEEGFARAARFLYTLRIYRVFDLPYQSQIVPLAAILATLGDRAEHATNHKKLEQWYWCGVFGELYSSTTENRIARDFIEVPQWLDGGPEPMTIRDSAFRIDRLDTMRMRLSAAYKGVNALLMGIGAHDFRTGNAFDHTIFFGENVDIHHIFPQVWCEKQGIPPAVYNSIVNKTPLSYQTNRSVGGDAPSIYLRRLEDGTLKNPAIPREDLDAFVASHLIDVDALRADDFARFYETRRNALARLIAEATGKPVMNDRVAGIVDDAELDLADDVLDAVETELLLPIGA